MKLVHCDTWHTACQVKRDDGREGREGRKDGRISSIDGSVRIDQPAILVEMGSAHDDLFHTERAHISREYITVYCLPMFFAKKR